MGSFNQLNGSKSEDLMLRLPQSPDPGYGSKLQPFQPVEVTEHIG
jgi:hypothetical protein